VRACVRVYKKMVHKYYMFQVNDKCIIKLYVIIKNIFFKANRYLKVEK